MSDESHNPEQIGKYKITGVLGRGGMGVVYKAQDIRIGRMVAIKTIHKEMLGGEAAVELRARFLKEIRAVGGLSHSNVIAVYDADEIDGEPYFVMEFVEGRELKDYLEEGTRFSLERVRHIMRQLLDAFDYTHKQDIVHRDIKPANIFVTEDFTCKVADFGIVKQGDSGLTQTGSVLGTPSYMSPEQCAGQNIDARSDLFALGIVAYELLAGEKPFQGNAPHAIMHRILNSEPDFPSVLNPLVPKAIDGVIAKALSKSPGERYQTAKEFLEALEAAFDGVHVDESGMIGNTQTIKPKKKAAQAAVPKTAIMGGVAAFVVILIIVGVMMFTGKDDASAPPDVATKPVVEPGGIVLNSGPFNSIDEAAAAAADYLVASAGNVGLVRNGGVRLAGTGTQPPFARRLSKQLMTAITSKASASGATPRIETVAATPQQLDRFRNRTIRSDEMELEFAGIPGDGWLITGDYQLLGSQVSMNVYAERRGADTLHWYGTMPANTIPSGLAVSMPQSFVSNIQTDWAAAGKGLYVTTDYGTNPLYRIGERMNLMIMVPEQSYLYCYYYQSSGEVMPIYPNPYHWDNNLIKPLAPGVLHTIPEVGNSSFSFDFAEPAGIEQIRCFATSRDVTNELPKMMQGRFFRPLTATGTQKLPQYFAELTNVQVAEASVVVTVARMGDE